MQEIFNKVLKENKLSSNEYGEVMSKVDKVISKLQDSLNEKNALAVVMLGGSSAKGTLVKGDFDCDVFVRFDRQQSYKDLSAMLQEALEVFDGIERVHGSRDYFQAEIDGINYEFIPVLEISSPDEAENVTDSSPLHVEWIKKKIEEQPQLTDQIILAKLFCKGIKVYGAESFIRGFSGHVLDILCVHYRSFEKLLGQSKNWLPGHVIDVEHHDSLEKINQSKTEGPLIVIDPIQPDRNAAASLNYEKFKIFKDSAKRFLKEPSLEYFIRKQLTIEELKENYDKDGTKLLVLQASPLEGKDDVVGSKIMKVFEHISKHFAINDFNILDANWEWDKKEDALLWFVVKDEELSEEKFWEGPPMKAKIHVEKFKEKHPDAFEKNGRICANIKREFTDAQIFLDSIIKTDYVNEKTEKIKRVL